MGWFPSRRAGNAELQLIFIFVKNKLLKNSRDTQKSRKVIVMWPEYASGSVESSINEFSPAI